MKTNEEKHITHFIRKPCQNKTQQEIKDAEERLKAYVNLVNRISTRIAQEQNSTSAFDEVSLSGVL